jgi:Na+-driven multidrug efflux pump
MCIIVGSNWFMLATLVVIFNALHASPQVAWLAMIAGIWLLTLALHPRYRSGHWRTIKVLGDPVAAA